MSQRNRYYLLCLAGVLLALILAACGTGQTSTAPTAGPAVVSTMDPTTVPSTTTANRAVVPTTAPTSALPSPTAAGNIPAATGDTAGIQKINLNSATAQEILTIPNTGNRMVREFQEYRPYTSILQFRREIGKYVDSQAVAEYEKYVFVPIEMNAADADTLQQIPGLDANEAAQLIAARPFASRDVFMSALSGFISADELAVAQQYLASS